MVSKTIIPSQKKSLRPMISTRLHNLIVNYNPIEKPMEQINRFFDQHPTLLKVALLVNHFFRTVSNIALMLMMPYSMPMNIACCFIGSLFYRVTVEKNCVYKFALPSFSGAALYLVIKNAMENITRRIAFESLSAYQATLIVGALSAHTVYVLLNVDYDVDNSCCHRH